MDVFDKILIGLVTFHMILCAAIVIGVGIAKARRKERENRHDKN